MIFLNNIPVVNPEVKYHGETIPPKGPLVDVLTDPTVNYAGKTLPQQRVTPQPFGIDPTNLPSSIVIGDIFLPYSTNIMIKGEKILAESQILDGVSVFEHISRKPYEIDFEILIWDSQSNAPFPQETINNIWSGIWITDTVQPLNNTFLNGIGILEIIIKSISPAPRLGSTNVMMKIKAFENQPGQTIII